MKLDRRSFVTWLGGSLLGAAACGGDEDAREPREPREPLDGGAPDARVLTQQDATLPDADAGCRPTRADALGPFYRRGAPSRVKIAEDDEPGERVLLSGRVLDEACQPIAGVLIDIWQADELGRYDSDSQDYRLRGQLLTAADGSFQADTIRPGNYPDANGMRPAHFHLMISHPGYRQLATQVYLAGDPYLAPNDSCTGCGSDDPARIVALVAQDGVLRGTCDLVLAGA